MLKRTLFFGNPYHISTRDLQLNIEDKESGEKKTVPIEDIGFIVFEHPHITFTQSVMQLLAENNASVIFCDQKFHPSSMLFHLDTHYIQHEKFKHQINASEPLKKQLWQQTIKNKINNQGDLLKQNGKNAEALYYKAKQVKSGDSTNEEAQAARKYWSELFGDNFIRERSGDAPNPDLNYGYAILRAATARSLAGSGLLSTLGIHHRNKYNSFCLADDIMEPYRPFVDQIVLNMQRIGLDCLELGKPEKAELLSLLTTDVLMHGQKSPLMVALSKTTSSLAKCFEGELNKIHYPEFFA
ncbi:MAG: type II CRISPR-associated endonuclease Cas1 [Crocinitomicaceae bacterium]|nr:type II CRISPR-associated endonuclease Cas1 [Crocinitomicaceae bacterium]